MEDKMDIIKSYLETMFANLPVTDEVIRAKDELWSMMEDKYNELINDGKSENEAVGTVISEFGNLEELSDTLGLKSQDTIYDNRRCLTLEEINKYIKFCLRRSVMIAIGIGLFIVSTIFPIIGDMIGGKIASNIGAGVMILVDAIGVGLIVMANTGKRNYDYIMNHQCILDYASGNYVKNEEQKSNHTAVLCKTLGVMLCIISIVPAIILDSIPLDGIDDIGGAVFMTIVGIAVSLIIYGIMIMKPFRTLLSLNGETMSYIKSETKEVTYSTSAAANIMSVFWPTVSCIYLSISFITFAWFATWVIWPVAGILHVLMKNILKEN
jgi:hypothetical protein